MMDEIQKRLLAEVADLHGVPEGAYNIRANGQMAARNTTANIDIVSKTDVSGIDIYIKPGTVNESVHIPVVLSQSGMKEMVYNDFHIGEGSDVVIVAGCGIDNCGDQDAEHDGIHRFFIEKNAKVKYVEKHYGAGDGKGKRILNPGTELCGEVSVAPIGISAALIEQQAAAVQVTEMADVVRAIKPREPESHKGSFGRLLCICGSTGMAGAAAMSISAALRCGVGLVDAALPRDIYPVVATQAQEAVYTLLDILPEGKYSVESRRSLEKSSSLCSAILLGCGLGVAPHTKALVEEVISGSRVPVILDADGINSILGHIDILKTTDVPLILTPHPGEMSRLMGKTVSEIQQNRVRYARQFAMDYAVTLVLKGAGTVIAAPDGSIWLNRTGNAGMAKGGSGDVLAGMLASFTAQGIPATAAAAVAVYLHGLAGDRCAAQLSQTAMLPTDLIAMLPKLFLEIGR